MRGMVERKNKNAKGRSAYRPRLVNGEHQRRRRRNADDEDCENLSEAECDRLALRDLETCNAEDKANRKLTTLELKLIKNSSKTRTILRARAAQAHSIVEQIRQVAETTHNRNRQVV
jgi:hypothetical protein